MPSPKSLGRSVAAAYRATSAPVRVVDHLRLNTFIVTQPDLQPIRAGEAQTILPAWSRDSLASTGLKTAIILQVDQTFAPILDII